MPRLKRLIRTGLCYVLYLLGIIKALDSMKELLPSKRAIKILCYHSVGDEYGVPLGLSVTEKNFENQIKFLTESYNIISLDEAVKIIRDKKEIPPRAIVITFDDGMRDNYTHVFNIVKRYNVPVTIFVTVNPIQGHEVLWTDYIIIGFNLFKDRKITLKTLGLEIPLNKYIQRQQAIVMLLDTAKKLSDEDRLELINDLQKQLGLDLKSEVFQNRMLSTEMIKEMCDNGISFGSHTMTHPILTKISLQKLKYELVESKKALEVITGKPIKFFAYPNGTPEDFDEQVVQLLKKSGYEGAVSTICGSNDTSCDLFSLKRLAIDEYSSLDCFGNFSKALFSVELSGILDILLLRKFRGII